MFHTIAGAMDDYIAKSDWRCPLFQWFYPQIAQDLSDDSPCFLGSEAHMQHIFGRIKEARVFHRKNLRVKKSRWMSVWDSLAEFLPFWSIYCLILVWTCLKYNIVKQFTDLQTDEFQQFAEAVPNPAGEKDKQGEQSREVRHSNKEADNLRKKARNTLHLACIISINTFKRKLAAGLLSLVEPTRTRFGKMLVRLKTQLGSVDWWSNQAAGNEFVDELREILAKLRDPKFHGIVSFGSADLYADGADAGKREADMKLGDHLWKTTMQVCGV
jgi:hypothetical protein